MVTKAEKIADVLDNSSYDQTDIVENLREAAKYIQANAVDLKDSVIHLCNLTLDKKADKSALRTLWVASEKSYAPRALEHTVSDIAKKLENTPSKSDLLLLADRITNQPSTADLISSISILSSKVDKLNLALVALGAKLDTDNTAQNAAVTSSTLDVDYETTISEDLA